MPYIGNKPEVGNFRKCDAITTSATATYNLLVGGVAVNPNQNQCIVSLNGVIQSSGNSYTIASSQITFASALTSSDVIDFILILGDTLDVGVPSDDTVDASKITANVITGQSALGATPADTDELLISDAGTLKRVDYSYLKSSVVNRPNVNPLIINGDMQIAQRGASVTGKTSSGYYTVDRMKNVMNNLGTWTIAQETLTSGNAFAAGFNKAYRIDCTTADASPAAGDTFFFTTYLEGQNVQCFKKGTANAETYTLSFWVKSNKTGTGQVNLVDNDNSRMCGASYTISSADTWEHKICTYAADTTGAFGNDNGRSLKMEWWLDSGSTYTSGTMPTAWEADSNADSNAAGTLSLADNTANDWAITGIQLEVGTYTSSTLPPFQFESFGENLRRCQRYYEKSYDYATAPNTSVAEKHAYICTYYTGGGGANDDAVVNAVEFKVNKRTAPTMNLISRTGTDATWYFGVFGASEATATATATYVTDESFTPYGDAVDNNANVCNGYFTANAEL